MRIWFPLLLGPVLALADQAIGLASAGWACANQRALVIQAIHPVFVAIVVAATLGAWRLWRATAGAGPDEALARRHFLAGLATASGTISAVAILAMWLPHWVLSPCWR